MLAVEVGGSSVQATLFEDDGTFHLVPLVNHRDDPWMYAAPGLIAGDRVRGAHHLGWMDVQASEELGMTTPPLLGINDAEASALGEWVLHGTLPGTMFYVVMGTGIGAVMIENGREIPVEFGHLPNFGPLMCGGCMNNCLDAQIGGHALPTPLEDRDIDRIVGALHEAMLRQSITADCMVLGGGMNRRYPQIRERLAKLTNIPLLASAAPTEMKSAAPFGLMLAWERTPI
jgi:hypothetical protein